MRGLVGSDVKPNLTGPLIFCFLSTCLIHNEVEATQGQATEAFGIKPLRRRDGCIVRMLGYRRYRCQEMYSCCSISSGVHVQACKFKVSIAVVLVLTSISRIDRSRKQRQRIPSTTTWHDSASNCRENFISPSHTRTHTHTKHLSYLSKDNNSNNSNNPSPPNPQLHCIIVVRAEK